ncbi:vesicular inhibitory amino acid transporter-like [Actinia tenebrosa]|uniref:Vesicular inhibitory amino acid transporter-like n=1 Tax=Actinia tenebrosa TaxID=6105 RepID=A0A6P8ILK0_ACTTE|nr:vesicular inhibitory amino acid transporter-like [Actinia tenebrosa]
MGSNDCNRAEEAYEKWPFAMLLSEDDDEVFITDSSTEHEDTEHKNIPTNEAVLNLLSGLVGSGLLALPYVISKGGVLAIIALVLVPFICSYTGKILIECMYERSYYRRKIRVHSSYREIGEACWPGKAGILTVTIQIIQLALSASSCIVLSASLLSHVLNFLDRSEREWIIIATILALPTVFVRSLAHVSWINILSITTLFSPIVVITGYGFFNNQPWDFKVLPLWNLEGVPLAISIITHSYVAHGALPVIEEGMDDKTKFDTMLKVTYVLCAVLRTTFAINGFFSYYGNINEIISNSLPPGILITVNTLLLIYSLLCYPFAGIALIHTVETSLFSNYTFVVSDRRWYIISRISLIVSSLFFALLIPRYAVLIAISGNLKSILGLILPCLFHLKLRAGELSIVTIIVDFFILALGIAIVVIGTVASVFQMIVMY